MGIGGGTRIGDKRYVFFVFLSLDFTSIYDKPYVSLTLHDVVWPMPFSFLFRLGLAAVSDCDLWVCLPPTKKQISYSLDRRGCLVDARASIRQTD